MSILLNLFIDNSDELFIDSIEYRMNATVVSFQKLENCLFFQLCDVLQHFRSQSFNISGLNFTCIIEIHFI